MKLWHDSPVRSRHRTPSRGRSRLELGGSRAAIRLEPPAPPAPRRRRLLDGLAEASGLLAEVGCKRLWLNGSFVTAKDEPGDFDACWDTDSVDLDAIDPVLLDLAPGRAQQKRRFGGELFPNIIESGSGLLFTEFFQNDLDAGRKGIVVIDLGEWTS